MVCCIAPPTPPPPIHYPQSLIFGAAASGDHHTSEFRTTPRRFAVRSRPTSDKRAPPTASTPISLFLNQTYPIQALLRLRLHSTLLCRVRQVKWKEIWLASNQKCNATHAIIHRSAYCSAVFLWLPYIQTMESSSIQICCEIFKCLCYREEVDRIMEHAVDMWGSRNRQVCADGRVISVLYKVPFCVAAVWM